MKHSYEAIVAAVIAGPMPCGKEVTWADVHSYRRTRAQVEARVLIAALAYRYMHDATYSKIGEFMCRDHSTIIYAVGKYEVEQSYFQPAFEAAFKRLQQRAHRQAALNPKMEKPMQIKMTSTDRIEMISGLRCRIWKGKTASGVECFVFVPTIAVAKHEDSSEFDRELEQQAHQPFVIDDRYVL